MDNTYLLDLMICLISGLRGNERLELVKKFDREEDFLPLSKKDIENFIGRSLKGRNWTMSQIRSMAEKDLAAVQRTGIRLVSWRENTYPPLLREIFDPPALLFCRGALPNPEKPLIAVVGTRKPTSAAGARAFALGRELGEAGIPVVSGLALGIDSMAHRGNLEGKAPTIAVLGSGPDMIYPSSNRPLARRILENGGLILSEYPPGTRPYKSNFPARNRIISGLSRGTVVVEAPLHSGALITARFALDQNRDLWVENTGVTSPRGGGTASLAGEGAAVISSARDILLDWNITSDKDSEQAEKRELFQNNGVGLASSMAASLNIKL